MQRDMAQGEADVSDAKVVQRYIALMERSKEAVGLLAGLPQYAFTCASIDPFVAKAFEGLGELWRLQLKYREVLARVYNIKRWEIGEIASRLGQLYYISFLRRSDPEALRHAAQYYQVIVARNYFELPASMAEKDVSYVVRKLRFMARFALVCIHLDKVDELEDLMRDIRSLVDTLKSVSTAHLDDVTAYTRILHEGDRVVEALKRDAGIPFKLPPRYLPVGQSRSALHVASAVFATNQEALVKFSELPLAALRLGQTLEYEPVDGPRTGAIVNKTYMYRPTVSALIAQVSAAVSRLEPPNHALVLYINANADEHGIIFEDDADGLRGMDLLMALRRPLFLILEGRGMKKWLGQSGLKGGRGAGHGAPFVAMASDDQSLTKYLCNPVSAVLEGRDLPASLDDQLPALDTWTDAMVAKLKAAPLHAHTAAFLTSPFTARYLARYLLCHTAAPAVHPAIHPPLPHTVLSDPSLAACLEQIQAAE
eukprot:TRINITY_DN25355_c0_g1_i1.p1 TRINITY_DN25355_c0_g1~~TRINITY_DN25355_c0_g1_i1.p1  ORF type:complete len:482 (+),score=147.48 TRINITY_DN25355_c0_g1_i1:45-1490(+)